MSIANFKLTEQANPQMDVERIDPDKAAKYLAENTRNRKIKVKHITNLAKAMTQGEWQVNGDAIRFDSNGKVVDGQHRLHAIIQSGVAITTVVIRNLDPDTFHTIDTNKVRGGADVLSIDGVVGVNPTVLAGAIRLVATSNFFDPDWRASTGNVKLTNNDVLRINKDYPNIRESVAATQGSDRRVCRKLMTPSGCAFLHCWLSSIDGEDAEIFFDWVEFTENIPREHPAQLLKNKLSEIQAGKSLGWKEKRMIYAVTFRAWNAVRDGEEIKVLRWSTTTKYPTPY